MISQRARYALQAALFLAARSENTPIHTRAIAKATGLPHKFLEQILLQMKKTGIVHSHRGRDGGYSLGRSAKDISFADVLSVTDGPLALSPCVSAMSRQKCDTCFSEPECVIRKALMAARDATAKILESSDLATASAQLKRAKIL